MNKFIYGLMLLLMVGMVSAVYLDAENQSSNVGSIVNWADTQDYAQLSATYRAGLDYNLTMVAVEVWKSGVAVDEVLTVDIYSTGVDNIPTTLIASALNSYSYADLPTSDGVYLNFTFSGVEIVDGVTYAIVMRPSATSYDHVLTTRGGDNAGIESYRFNRYDWYTFQDGSANFYTYYTEAVIPEPVPVVPARGVVDVDDCVKCSVEIPVITADVVAPVSESGFFTRLWLWFVGLFS